MSLEDNINNAFSVVIKTYENIDKLMRFCDSIALDCNYIPSTTNFLRYKSDADYNGWLTTSFIKLYQSNNDKQLKNEWQDGPVFAMNIYLLEEPVIYLAKYEFENISGWTHSYFSAAAHWLFGDPIHSKQNGFLIEELKDNEGYFVSQPVEAQKEKYWKLIRVVYTKIYLTRVTSDNANDLIFGDFDTLKYL